MVARRHIGLSEDDGISLVEVMVSVVLLAVVLAAFASTLTQAMINVSADEQLVRATHLAADELEGLRSLRWEDVGFYTDDPGYAATAGSEPTVTLGTTRPVGAVAPLPQYRVDRDGMAYDVQLEVVWKDDAAQAATTEDYKELRIHLDWSVKGRDFEATAAATRAPTLDEVPLADPTCVPSTVSDFAVNPSVVAVGADGRLEQQVTVTVDVCPPVSSVTVTRPSGVNIPLTDLGGDRWQHRSYPGTGGFLPGDETWTATVVGTEGSDQAERDVTFTSAEGDDLEVLSLDVSPEICVNSGNRKLVRDVVLTTEVTGDPSHVTISWTEKNKTRSAAAAHLGGGTWRVTIDANNRQFDDATTTISVLATRTTDTVEADETFTVPVSSGSC